MGQFGFNIAWAGGWAVVVEACKDLTRPIWSPVGPNTFISRLAYFRNQQWTNHSGRFYHLRPPWGSKRIKWTQAANVHHTATERNAGKRDG